MRLELTRRNRHYPLKVACLPIPPPTHLVFMRSAQNRTRTCTVAKPLAPETSASTIPPPGHFITSKKTISPCLSRAEDGTRTRDPNLGKVMLYQLSYFRNCDCKVSYIFQLSKLSFFFLFLLYVFSANENIKQMAVCHNRKLTCCILNSTSVIYICKLLSVSSSIHNFFANSDAP